MPVTFIKLIDSLVKWLIQVKLFAFGYRVLNFEHGESLFCIVTTGHRLDRVGYRWIFIMKIISDQWRPLFNYLKCLSKKENVKKYCVQSFSLTKRTVGHARVLCACQGNYYGTQI